MSNACETNVFDANQISAFHYAAVHGNIDIGYLLSDNNAKLDPKDRVRIHLYTVLILLYLRDVSPPHFPHDLASAHNLVHIWHAYYYFVLMTGFILQKILDR